MASRPSVTIKEISIPAATLSNAVGRMAYVVHSTKGIVNDYMFIESEQDLLDTIGAPDSDATSRDFHICKAFLSYGSDLVLYRAINEDTAKLSRIGIDFSLTGLVDNLSETGDEVFFREYETHNLKTGMDLEFYAREPYANGDKISVAICKWDDASTDTPTWQDVTDTVDGDVLFSDAFEFGPVPSKEEIAVAVLYDGDIVEKFIVSLNPDNKNDAGELNYIKEYIANKSAYIYAFAKTNVYSSVTSVEATSLQDGSAGSTPSDADVETAYSKFKYKNDITFDYITDGTHANNRAYVIGDIAEFRKDCIAFVGPKYGDIIGISSTDTIVSNLITDRQSLGNSSWALYISNWKYTYDKYQGKNIWIPITADFIGNKVRTNTERELWIPAAGNTNGRIKNVIKLAFNPTDNQQNELYKNGCNHVVFKPGKGFIFDGQKTMINQNIGVSRLNVRDLFRLVENYVAGFADDFLHEFNDAVTRARFKSLIDPYLEDIKNRGGIIDYLVVCDETNNTDAVIDSYGFRCDVMIKSKRPIEDIMIRFFDVPSGIAFTEVAA